MVGDDPEIVLTGPIPATQRILQRSGLTIDDIDAYEVNEAFAPVPLASCRDIGADPDKLNPRGGAIAPLLGTPRNAANSARLAARD